MSMHVCLSVCLSVRMISPESHARSLRNFSRMLPISVARSSSGTLTIGRIAYRRDGGDWFAQRGRSVIYDCLVTFRVSRIQREMYCGHARLCVCVSVHGRMPTPLHGPGCNLEEW